MRKEVFVDCTNYFNEVGQQRLRDVLEAGNSAFIYIDCIGHTATMIETYAYVKWLKQEYGDRLATEKNEYGDKLYYLKK